MPETDRLPKMWRPFVGSSIEGFVTLRSVQPNRFGGDAVPVLVIDDGEEQRTVWCGSMALREMVKKLDPQPGQYFQIMRGPSTITKSGREYKNFDYERVER